jgi:lipopolysaccharide transport system permease protein
VSVIVDDVQAVADVPAPLPERPTEPPLTVIESRAGVSFADVQELWRYRELLYYLVLRELKLRYKQTILGVGWSLFQPLSIMLMLVVFVGRVGGIGDRVAAAVGYPYELFVLTGALPWTFFSATALNAGHSLLANERLVTKVYFPRLMLPLSNSGSALVDFCIAAVLVIAAMVYFGVAPAWSALLLPAIVAAMFITAAGIGIAFAALIVSQRDFRYLLLFGVQLWMLATPCIYDTPGPSPWLPLNPAYGLIKNFRAALFGAPLDWPALAVSTAVGLLIAAAGLAYFRKVERTFADTI